MNDKKISFNCRPDDDSKVIFEEVCRQIGLYYKDKENFKSLKRKLRWQNDVVQVEFGFWSSHSNMRGDWVNFEIIPSIYALDNSGMEKNGLVYTLRKPINFNVCHIDSELFYKIIEAIENEIEFAQKICTKEGFSDFLEENKNRNFIAKETNNLIFMEKLSKQVD